MMWKETVIILLLLSAMKYIDAENENRNDGNMLDCKDGRLLSSNVCIPLGYLKGEVPDSPTIVNTKLEINNIREVNNKKMRITLDYYQELFWIDNRLETSLSEGGVSVVNNNLIEGIWKPDLWIQNLCDFKPTYKFEYIRIRITVLLENIYLCPACRAVPVIYQFQPDGFQRPSHLAFTCCISRNAS